MSTSLADKLLPKAVKDGVHRTLAPHIKHRAHGKGVCSASMRAERRQLYLLMVAQLWELGFRIRKLESLSGKHVVALINHWHQQGLAVGTLHTRLSKINVLCEWLGKHSLVKRIDEYLPADQVRRQTVAKESKAWKAKDIDPLEIIERAKKIDERLAVMLAMQHHFGLRVKESIEIRPANTVVDGGKTIEIHEGTKGGKVRRIPIRTEAQKAVIEWARKVAITGQSKRLRWEDCTWTQAQNRFYNFARKRLGITGKGLGVTAHGLRHGYAHESYHDETGLPTPVEGGALGKIDRETHAAACLTVSRALGHGRIDVTTGYYGSYGHALRVPVPKTMNYSFPTV